jgi:hypothetical protein
MKSFVATVRNMPMRSRPMKRRITVLGLILTMAALAPADPKKTPPDVGKAYSVPYRLTLTNHYLVRVKINGKGPFNFLVDTGAPALYIGTEAAKAIGLEPSKTEFFTDVDRLDLEGGASLTNIKGRVEDPFQLVGMNALGLPGAKIEGILGFTILARFKMEFDPTKDRMTWTRLDYEPKEPFIPAGQKDRKAPAEVEAMSMLGPAMKLASVFIGKQPEDIYHPQGLLGIELDDHLKITAILADSPAARAGIQVGDTLVSLRDKSVADRKAAHLAIAPMRAGDKVVVVVDRDGKKQEFSLVAADGL